MNTKLLLPLLLLCSLGFADGAPGHAHAAKPDGPNGGRVLAELTPRAELFVTAERKLRLTFLDEAGQAVAPPADATVTVITGDRAAPATLTFAADGASLLSTTVLPPGENLPAVVRVRTGADAKTVTVRVQLNLAACGECSRPEYTCTCAH